jgi:hypothetical protein
MRGLKKHSVKSGDWRVPVGLNSIHENIIKTKMFFFDTKKFRQNSPVYKSTLRTNSNFLSTLQREKIIYIETLEEVNKILESIPPEECTKFSLANILDLDGAYLAFMLGKNSRWLERINFEVALRIPVLQQENRVNMTRLCLGKVGID